MILIETFFNLLLVFIFGICWGSFLNVVAVRSVAGKSLFPRSACPFCGHRLSCGELIPILSWVWQRGVCRSCARPISFWYPAIELLSGVWMVLLVLTIPGRLMSIAFILSSALIVTIRTDGEYFLIARLCSLGLIPYGIAAAWAGFGFVSLFLSLLGAIIGFAILYGFNKVFCLLRGYSGLGEGDMELMAGIGSILGPIGAWMTLLIGSLLGLLYAIGRLILYRDSQAALPFGLFLALGAGFWLICQSWLGPCLFYL